MAGFAGSGWSEAVVVRALAASDAIRKAFAFVDADGERMTRELVELCEIEAPPFHEEARGSWFLERFRELGLGGVRRDEVGNVVGVRHGSGTGPHVVLSAHLDTVFPPGTDCRVRREGTRLYAPGIGDDCSGLAAMLAVIRALDAGGVGTRLPVAFLATVGEEGEGDLRGVRHFFEVSPLASSVSAFVSLDGPGVERITNRALGSRRFRVAFTGPGGHSWGDFGIVNPIHALGRAVARLANYPAPIEPRTTYNVGRVEGGRSVNAISQEASMSVDLRSTSPAELDRLEAFFRRAVAEAGRDENRLGASSGSSLGVRVEQIGNRPSGETSPDAPIVRILVEASRAVGVEPRFDCSSTDSNIPISLGIPAVTIGSGGQSANAHSLGEWFDPRGREVGIKRALLAIAALAGAAG
jgi:acetylornithine deacetylase/succinyl-diaminopimelate desuccinylase-like protein